MKKIALSLMTLGLLQSTAALATAPTPVPAAIAEHNGPIRIAVIRNLGSDDNTTQFVAGALQEGKKLGFKISTFLSNGDDAKFRDFVNRAISQKYDGIILSQGVTRIPPPGEEGGGRRDQSGGVRYRGKR